MKRLTLILGGARSGKSAFAERLASRGKRVLFVATAEALDAEMKRRIAEHRRRRPRTWHTLEAPRDLPKVLAPVAPAHDTVLLDCLTLWVSNLLLAGRPESTNETCTREVDALLRIYESGAASWIVVSNEVGLGIVPNTPLGRRYRDALGLVNQRFAQRADKVYLMVAGLAVDLKALSAP